MRSPMMMIALAAVPALAQTAQAPASSGTAGTPPAATPDAAATPPAAPTGTPSTTPQAGTSSTDVTPQLTVGATVYDAQGGQVGTIETVTGQDVVVSTGSARATLASSSFARGANGPVIGMTKGQLEAAVRDAAKAPGGR